MANPHKSDRLKKLEKELEDLEQWLKLGLVPKKDEPKHKDEIAQMRARVDEELDRLRFLKDNGDLEEYVAPKRQANRPTYQTEMPSIPDIEFGEGQDSENYDSRQSATEAAEESSTAEDQDDSEEDSSEFEEESFFSDRSSWRSEGIIDPESDDW